jgi:hypothetical protein
VSENDRCSAAAAVARHFSATLRHRRGSRHATLMIAGNTVALHVLTFEPKNTANAQAAQPRLRLDRVALGLVHRLRSQLQDAVPEGCTVLFTITAPIRRAAKSAVGIEVLIRARVRGGPSGRSVGTIHGNSVQVVRLKGSCAEGARLVGLVHNPDADPAVFVELTRALLSAAAAARRSGARAPRKRWLAIESRARRVPIETYRNICQQLRLALAFEQILAIVSPARVEKLSGG